MHTLSYQFTVEHPVYITKCLHANERLARGAGSWHCHVGLARARLCALFFIEVGISLPCTERMGGWKWGSRGGRRLRNQNITAEVAPQTCAFLAFLMRFLTESRSVEILGPVVVDSCGLEMVRIFLNRSEGKLIILDKCFSCLWLKTIDI